MIRAPEPLEPHHPIEGFDCGVPSLNAWLQRRALANQVSGASRTFVACDSDRVVGYFALASSAVAPAAATGRFRRNMPDPVPVVVLGRLAVALSHHGQALGRALFQDAALRVVHAADAMGIRGMIVHALSEEAKAFYLYLGLDESPLDPMTLMVTVADLRAALK
jgi:GNAT superfamily N-acetyltransferase